MNTIGTTTPYAGYTSYITQPTPIKCVLAITTKKEVEKMADKVTSFKKGFIETKDNEQKEVCVIEQTGKEPTTITKEMFAEIKTTMKW